MAESRPGERSEAVTEGLSRPRAKRHAIEDATDPLVRTSLVADKLLVFRNFAGAVIGGIATYGSIATPKPEPGWTNLPAKAGKR